MGKIKGWEKISSGHLNDLHEWQNTKTKQRVLYYPYGFSGGSNSPYKLIMETREGVKEGIVSNKHSANFGAMNYMRENPNG